MKVVILCGGLGTRLREETEYRPKPMVPIGNRPILWHIMKHYAAHGHKDFILCLGYKGEVIKDFFRNYHWNTSDVTIGLGQASPVQWHNSHDEDDWKVTMIDTGEKTLTGGRLKRVLPFIDDEEFLLTYGDGVSDVNVAEVIAFHRSKGATVTLTGVRPGGRFGEIGLDNGMVTSFLEKPDESPSYINGGFFVMKKAVGELLSGDDCILERSPLETLSKAGQLAAYQHDGFWQCMDNVREMALLNELWNGGKAPWKTW
ncbi:glucose-1-phosphate cytidylyltransferase [Verrucomicrobium sp. BvORR106]|uniref:glucose-1-phosphate cytidylyltransferase n=1 Tax=Verrucomicrobium sp. BvORR106 TaxID=1403819 RepID=UPI000570BD68|nr:glucose-1-phosphate cytidylyltransferase [Verrucomicrobium sp. BvORR106]